MNKKNLKIRMFIEALRQQKLNAVVTMIILGLQLLIVSFAVWDEVQGMRGYQDPYEYQLLEVQPFLIAVPSIILAIMLYSQFAWLNKRSESDFYHSIPIKRIWLLIVNVAASVLLCTVIFWGFAFLAKISISLISFGKVKLIFGELFKYFMIAFTMGMMLSGAIMIGRGLAGRTEPAILLAMIIIYGPRTLLWTFRMIMEEIIPYVSIRGGVIWEVRYNLMFIVGAADDSWGPLVYSLCLCLVYWIVATVLFVKRKSEIAEKIAANSKVQLFIRLFIAFIISIFPNWFVLERILGHGGDDFNAVIFALYVLAFAAYFLYELVSTRKISSMAKAAPGAVILVALDIVMIICCAGYINYNKNVEITPDNIKSISFEFPADRYDSSSIVFGDAYAGVPIKSEKLNKLFYEKLENAKEDRYLNYWDMEYKVETTGGTYYRKVNISLEELILIIRDTDIAQNLRIELFVNPNEIDRSRTSTNDYNLYCSFYEKAMGMSADEFVDWYLDVYSKGKTEYVYMAARNKKSYTYYIPVERYYDEQYNFYNEN